MKKLFAILLVCALLFAAACAKTPPETTAAPETIAADQPETTVAAQPDESAAATKADAEATTNAGENEGLGDAEPDGTTAAVPAETAPIEEPAGGWVRAAFRDDYPIGDGEYDSFDASVAENPVEIVFFTETELVGFRVLSIRITGYGDYGTEYTYENLHVQAALTPDRPLAVTLNFLGDTPNNGIAFEDPNGVTHFCSVDLSGRDGSLVISELSQLP